MASEQFEGTIERSTGMSIEILRRTPLDELRRNAEQQAGKPIQFYTAYPWAGRGSVMKDRLVSHEEANKELDHALRRL